MRSVFFGGQVFSETLRACGCGRIANITLLAGQNGGTVASAHCAAAKAGAILPTKCCAQQLAGSGATANAIPPGPIPTAKGRLSAEQIAAIEQRVRAQPSVPLDISANNGRGAFLSSMSTSARIAWRSRASACAAVSGASV